MPDMLENSSLIRLTAFVAIFIIMAVLETLWPRRKRVMRRFSRWFANIGIVFVSAVVVRLVVPIAPVGVALWVDSNQLGLLNWLDLQGNSAILAGVVLLDLVVYGQHLAMHKVPLLWRLHRLHHTDIDFDVTTAIRFHPVEIIVSLFYKMAFIVFLGIPAVGVVIFEILLNGMALFNHANFKLPLKVDAWLRYIIVTPDVHRVHHSVHQTETDSNFGFHLTLWDRVFGTYVAQPRDGHEKMSIGLEYLRDEKEINLLKLLRQPFRK